MSYYTPPLSLLPYTRSVSDTLQYGGRWLWPSGLLGLLLHVGVVVGAGMLGHARGVEIKKVVDEKWREVKSAAHTGAKRWRVGLRAAAGRTEGPRLVPVH